MITIFKTGEFDYSDIGIDKPVRYSIENLIEVASRTSRINVTKEHTNEVLDEMSNFIVKDGLLMADEPNNLKSKGMGYSPVFNYDLIDMGEYYEPKNIVMTEIGYTQNPRTKIIYNSIEVPNGEGKMADDTAYQKLVEQNNELREQIGVYKKQQNQFNKQIKEKDKEIEKIKEQYADTDKKLAEYDALKEIEASYNKIVSSQREDLIYKICGKDKAKAEKFKDYSVEQLKNTVELLEGQKGGKGVYSKGNHVDDGNDPSNEDDEHDEDEYTDEMFEDDFKNSGL